MANNRVTVLQSIAEVLNSTDKVAITAIAITYWSRVILVPVSILFGLAGNVLLFISMQMPTFSNTSFSIYCKAIAIVDSVILFGLLPRWLRLNGFVHMSDKMSCRWVLITIFNLYNISNWLLVALNADRLIKAVNPTFANKHMRPKCSQVICVIFLILCSTTYFLLPLATHDMSVHYILGGPRCMFATTLYLFKTDVITIVYNILGNVLPTVIITVSGVYLYLHVKRIKKKVGKQAEDKVINSIRKLIAISFYHSLTAVVNFVLPYLARLVKIENNTRQQVFLGVLVVMANNFYLSNHYIKFYVLIIQSRDIRNEFKKICTMKCCRCKPKKDAKECESQKRT